MPCTSFVQLCTGRGVSWWLVAVNAHRPLLGCLFMLLLVAEHASLGACSFEVHHGRRPAAQPHQHPSAHKRLLVEQRHTPHDESTQARTSTCLPECTSHGTCNEELGRCDCPRHLSGEDCSVETSDVKGLCNQYGYKNVKDCFDPHVELCLNACNGRGKCTGSFCKCDPGFYGTDCALSMDEHGKPILLEGQGYRPRQRAPKIYVYELPPNLNNNWFNPVRLDRPLYYLFWQRLLSAGVRVADGEEADFYFLPIKARMGRHDTEVARFAVEYIREHWPWWDRYEGGKHIVVQTGDMGRNDMYPPVPELYKNSIWLHHWGLHRRHDYAGWAAAHRPGLDIVIPVYVQPALVKSYGMVSTHLHPGSQSAAATKNQTFFFAGRICGDRKQPRLGDWPNCGQRGSSVPDGYSAGTRQKLHYHHSNRTGFQIVTHTKAYGHDMANSVFCGAPTGGGHGKRNVLVTVLGCIPVTVTDNVYQPFEPEIHWDKFSVALPEADIPQMHVVLANVTEDKREYLQANLWCGAQHLFWSSIFGGVLGDDGRYDAFETVMEILRMRLQYPDLPPEKYADSDADFARFMRCESMPQQTPPELCSHHPHSKKFNDAITCQQCSNAYKNQLGVPGGAICCAEKMLAKCPRLWD